MVSPKSELRIDNIVWNVPVSNFKVLEFVDFICKPFDYRPAMPTQNDENPVK